MFSVTVRVTGGPRWDAGSGKFQYLGEEVKIQAEDYAEFVGLCADHEVHCQEVVDGDWPPEVDTPGYPRIYPSDKQPEPEPEPEPESAPVYEGPIESNECPGCGQAFKSPDKLRKHMAKCIVVEETEESQEGE